MGMFYDLKDVQDYLDEQIEENKRWMASKDFNSQIYAMSGLQYGRIWLNDGVEFFADVLGQDVKVARVPLPDGKMCVYKSFDYKGYEVYQVKQEESIWLRRNLRY